MIPLKRGQEGYEENLELNTILYQPLADPGRHGQLGYCTGGGRHQGEEE